MDLREPTAAAVSCQFGLELMLRLEDAGLLTFMILLQCLAFSLKLQPLVGRQQSIQRCFPQPSPAESGKIQIGWVVCEMGRKLANRLHSEGGDQWFLLRLAASHEWDPPGTNTGPHGVQHLHK